MIPKNLREIINVDPYYRECARKSPECDGRITIEHAFIYAGKQVNELWALIPLCWKHHLGSLLNKRENHRIALARATDEDLMKYPKKDWAQMRRSFEQEYENEPVYT